MLEIQEETSTILDPKPSYLSITTITSTFSVNTPIDIQVIREHMESKQVKMKRTGDENDEGIVWNLKENRFFNQITVEYRDKSSKKSIKIFPNGSVHVTGCSDTVDCHRVMSQIKCFVQKFSDEGKQIQTSNFEIRMINANFCINSVLNLSKVTSTFESLGCIVSFKPEIYSAVRIKFVPGPNMKRITASVFSSGCVLITGAKTLREVTASYQFLIENLSNGNCIVRPNQTDKPFNKFMNVSFQSWKKHLLGTR